MALLSQESSHFSVTVERNSFKIGFISNIVKILMGLDTQQNKIQFEPFAVKINSVTLKHE